MQDTNPAEHAEETRQRVKTVGEFELIRLLTDVLPESVRAASSIGIGIGDDAAVWTPPTGEDLVVTTDALVERVHFRLDWTDWRSLGHKLLAVNLSDLAAMGATPKLATVVLGLTGEERVHHLLDLYKGMGELAAAHGLVIAGGDIVRSPEGVLLSVTAIGSVSRGQALRRDGARPGNLVAVSGTLGASAAGMELLVRDEDATATGPLLRAAHLRPNPRVALGKLLYGHGVTAAMDLSDGLLGDVPKIAEASGVSAIVDIDRLPILPAVRTQFPDRFETMALRGGEDFELLMTIPPDRLDSFSTAADEVGATLTVIGEIVRRTGSGAVMLRRDGIETADTEGAFDHFGT